MKFNQFERKNKNGFVTITSKLARRFKNDNIDYTPLKEMTLLEACKIWNAAGIMANPKYWLAAVESKNIPDLDALIINAAKRGFKSRRT